MLEQLLDTAMNSLALVMEGLSALVIAIGAANAVVGIARGMYAAPDDPWRRRVWLQFAVWIILALEFALAADIVRTAVDPSWDGIGKLAAIAAIRTALNFFLWRDVDEGALRSPGKRSKPA